MVVSACLHLFNGDLKKSEGEGKSEGEDDKESRVCTYVYVFVHIYLREHCTVCVFFMNSVRPFMCVL